MEDFNTKMESKTSGSEREQLESSKKLYADYDSSPAEVHATGAGSEKFESADRAVLDLGTKLAAQIGAAAGSAKTGAEWLSQAADLVDGNLNPDYYLKAWAQVHVDSSTGPASDADRNLQGKSLEKELQRVLKIDQMNLPWSEKNDASWPLQFKIVNGAQEIKLSMIVHLSSEQISKPAE
jgi:hypothetical protein